MISRIFKKLIVVSVLATAVATTTCQAAVSDMHYERCARMVQKACMEYCLENGTMPSSWHQAFIVLQACGFNVATISVVISKLQLS